MRQFTLQIGNDTRGPLTEDEVAAMIAEGALTPDTPCRPEGAAEWTPLSDHFRFGAGLKVLRAKPVANEAEEELASTRLAPETRQRLLAYGLADAATVDAFTEVQGLLAIADHEQALKRLHARHRAASVVAFLSLGALGAFAGFVAGPVADLLDLCVRPFVQATVDARTSLLVLRSEIRQFEEIRQRAERAVFARPTGGTPGLNLIATRLQFDPATSFVLRGQADTAPLTRRLTPWGLRLDDDRRVYVLRDAPSARLTELLKAQGDILEEVLSPPLDEAGFAQLFAEVMTTFPAATFAEAGRLKAEAAGMRMSGLQIFIDRVDFRAQAAASQAAQKGWGGELTAFSGRLKELKAKAYALTAPAARRQRWSEFSAGPGAELATLMLTSGVKAGRVAADGSFAVAGAPGLNASTLSQVIVSARIAGDTVFLPWGSRLLGPGRWNSEAMPNATLIERERYRVTDKVAVGGRSYQARLQTPTHDFVYARSAPVWRYLAVARDRDKEPVFALVDEKTFEAARKGDVLPVADLAKTDLYLRAAESERPDGLYEE